MNILGIHGGVTNNQHDPAAALIRDGKLVFAAEEERFERVKSPRGHLPIRSIRACLKESALNIKDIDIVLHAGETYEDMPARIESYFIHYFGHMPELKMINHHLAHMASAFYCSGFKEAMIVSYDGIGDRLSTATGIGTSEGITVYDTNGTDKSLGMFYASITSFLGFKIGEDEYKVMGLAPYGKPGIDLTPFVDTIGEDYYVNPEFFQRELPNKCVFEPFYTDKLIELLGPPRLPETEMTQHYRDISYAVQASLEKCAIAIVNKLHKQSGSSNLCLAGGVALNCSANMVLSQLDCVEKVFVQPASSDRGLALGCAYQGAMDKKLEIEPLKNIYLGPSYSNSDILNALKVSGIKYTEVENPSLEAAKVIASGKIIGWWNARSEYGPRALGNRSILADPRKAEMKDLINNRIKFREEFRPFAPSVLEERANDIFELDSPSPFMTIAVPVRKDWRSKIAAVTHVNGTARVQTVNQEDNPAFYSLISEFYNITKVPVVLNTSFNVRGQPIVETPLDALATFAGTGIDILFLQNYMLIK